MEEMASYLGPKEVCFVSCDDKAKVCIGLTAATKQSLILMHLEYKVSLPDHDFVVAARHKLIPSVYAAINIKPSSFGNKDAVGYSGPTYIAIRSGKHSSSTAHSHGLDIERLINLPEFHSITKFNGKVKPVFMLTVDGGPDENPRYEKTIKVGIHHFVKQDLDVLIIATNAPHRSAFNRAERRMAPLSKDLSGLILPHDHFGSHLNSKCETIDERKEKLNFQFAGEILSQIWSETVIDGYETVAEFILPEHSDLNAIEQKDEKWIAKHVLSSQYMTQIIKCNDRSCCSAARSSYFKIMKKNEMMPFLPPPVPLEQSDDGVVALKNRSHEHSKFASLFVLNSLHMEDVLSESYKEYGQVPYDLYCPSVQKNLKSRICGTCKKYFATVVMLKAHIKVCHRCVSTSAVALIRPRRIAAQRASELLAIIGQSENDEDAEWLNVDDVEEGPKSVLQIVCEERAAETKFPTVSIKQHFECPWVDNE